MRLELEVELRDVPGQLGFVLDQVATFGGNVESIVHRRADTRGEWVPVALTLDIAPARSHRLVEALSKKVRVLQAGGKAAGVPLVVMLVGHVFDNRVEDFLNTFSEQGCRVHRVQAEMRDREHPSAVFVDVTADDEKALERTMERVESLAQERGIQVLRSLRDEEVEA
jgi:ACT domain-containing protein